MTKKFTRVIEKLQIARLGYLLDEEVYTLGISK
jgi:hypothetical protein